MDSVIQLARLSRLQRLDVDCGLYLAVTLRFVSGFVGSREAAMPVHLIAACAQCNWHSVGIWQLTFVHVTVLLLLLKSCLPYKQQGVKPCQHQPVQLHLFFFF